MWCIILMQSWSTKAPAPPESHGNMPRFIFSRCLPTGGSSDFVGGIVVYGVRTIGVLYNVGDGSVYVVLGGTSDSSGVAVA